jgi:hypothetical protein
MEPIFAEMAKKNLVVSTGGANPRPLQKSVKVAIDTQKEVAKIAEGGKVLTEMDKCPKAYKLFFILRW